MPPVRPADPRLRNIPDTGKYFIDDWAEIMDATRQTVETWISTMPTKPTITFGRTVIVDAAKWWPN